MRKYEAMFIFLPTLERGKSQLFNRFKGIIEKMALLSVDEWGLRKLAPY